MSAYRIDFQNNRPALFLFAGWAVVSSLLLFALFPNWVTAVFLVLIWFPLSYFVHLRIIKAFADAGTILLDGEHITLMTQGCSPLKGQIHTSSILFDAFIAIKVHNSNERSWLCLFASSMESVAWSRLRRAVVAVKEQD